LRGSFERVVESTVKVRVLRIKYGKVWKHFFYQYCSALIALVCHSLCGRPSPRSRVPPQPSKTWVSSPTSCWSG